MEGAIASGLTLMLRTAVSTSSISAISLVLRGLHVKEVLAASLSLSVCYKQSRLASLVTLALVRSIHVLALVAFFAIRPIIPV